MSTSSLNPSFPGTYFLNVFSLFLTILISYLTHLEANHESQLLIQLPRPELLSHERAIPRNITVLHVDDFGAKGDGVTDDTEAVVNVWKVACSHSEQSAIVFAEGNTYLVHPIDFAGPCQSNVTLKISGAIIAPKDPDVWHALNPKKWLYFHGFYHLSLDGGGTIDGMGEEWWARSCKVNSSMPCHHAPTAITFHRCENLKVRDLNLVNSQQVHLSFTDCSKVTVSNVTVSAPRESPNTDGIHLSSSANVVVIDSIIRTGDDCISIVNNSSRVLITNVVCGPGHGISIGSLGERSTCAEVRDVMVDGALLLNTKNGVRIKTWQGGSGSATDIAFRNVLMKNVSNPIIIDQYYCDSPFPCENQTSAVQVARVSFINVKGTSATGQAIAFACSDSYPCEGLYLEDIQLVSFAGKRASSFCWNAYGSSSGLVFPPPCFPSIDGALIEQKASPSSIISSYSE